MKKLLAFPLSLILCLSACQKKESSSSKQQLRLNLHTEPPTLDPRKATDTTSIQVINMCFEGLTRCDKEGNAYPAIAEKIEVSADCTVYTFTLREAKWSDGEPVTAQDFEKTWKTILSPSFPCEFASDFYFIKNAMSAKLGKCSMDQVGIKTIDDKTFVVELEHPVPYFLTLTATHSFFPVPQHIVESHPDWAKDSQFFISNGPFQLAKWRHYSLIKVVKNDQYWDKEQVKLEGICLFLIEDENTELSMFENGELDWAGTPLSALPIDAIPTLKEQGGMVTFPMSGTYFYIFNTKKYPFTNANIRKAFTYAIDRQSIVDNITQSGQLPAMALVPPTIWKENRSYFKDNDKEEAKRCFKKGLKELGITAEKFPTIALSYNTLSSHHKIAQAIQEQWFEVLGVKVTLENKEWKVFLDELSHHQFQVARMGGIASFRDPVTFLDLYRYMSSSNNHSEWTNPQFTALLEKADLTIDPAERLELLRQAEQVFMDEMPLAPIYFYTGSYLKKPYVKDVIVSDLSDADYKHAYLEKND